jgi:hypothetical protein
MPPHLVIDGFLPDELHDALLEHALGQEAALTRSGVRQYGVRERGDYRRSWVSPDGFGVLQERFSRGNPGSAAVLFEQLRMPAFESRGFEIELSAHRDGDYFRPHIDTSHRSIATERPASGQSHGLLFPRPAARLLWRRVRASSLRRG